jgi:hypothetical protein
MQRRLTILGHGDGQIVQPARQSLQRHLRLFMEDDIDGGHPVSLQGLLSPSGANITAHDLDAITGGTDEQVGARCGDENTAPSYQGQVVAKLFLLGSRPAILA